MTEFYAGLMSGTSMDGVDAVLCEFAEPQMIRVVSHTSVDYEPSLRQALLTLQSDEHAISLRQYAEFDSAVARTFAKAALQITPQQNIKALGVHGQTIFHDPRPPWTNSLQIGNPGLIAQMTGHTVVADFRRADIACGGQGAPLVPAFHWAAFASSEQRAVLNVGGIANLTLLPGRDAMMVRGWDLGPGNALMDEWMHTCTGEQLDDNGNFAASGQVHAPLLDALLDDSYFQQAPPKSTGRGYFNLRWAFQRFPQLHQIAPQDVQRSFCELTAMLVTRAMKEHACNTVRLLLCGGGAKNGFLVNRISALNPQVAVSQTAQHGIDGQAVEAAAFAWLAMRTMNGLPGNLPAVTGASRPVVLGGIFRG